MNEFTIMENKIIMLQKEKEKQDHSWEQWPYLTYLQNTLGAFHFYQLKIDINILRLC